MAKKFFLVAVLAAALLSSTALFARASVPDPANSSCDLEWEYLNVANPTPVVVVCPSGDGSALAGSIIVKDQFNAPMGGVAVILDVDVICDDIVWCKTPTWLPDTTLITDASGVARLPMGTPNGPSYDPPYKHSNTGLHLCAGRDVSGPPEIFDCCDVQYTVTCLGVTLCVETRELTSPDLNQFYDPGPPASDSRLYVEGLDYSIFGVDWEPLPGACRTDYNADGDVEGLDYSFFAQHWLHACDVMPSPATTNNTCP
jgi:hypothetical protein